MPRYIFEQSVTLPAGESITATEARAIAVASHTFLQQLLIATGRTRLEVACEEPIEQVTGDWLPPDENGSIKMGASRPIDL